MYHWITVGKLIDFFLRLSNDATAFLYYLIFANLEFFMQFVMR